MTLELYCFPSAWQLSSIDYECLKVISYFQVMQVPFERKTIRDASISPSGSLPFVRNLASDTLICGSESILSHVKDNGFDLDQHLNTVERADMDSYICLLESSILDAISYELWIREENFKSFTLTQYARLITSFSFLRRPYAMNIKRQSCLAQSIKSRSQIENDFKTALSAFNERYAQPRFFGHSLSSLDIYLYSALSLLVKLPWPERGLSSHLAHYPRLVSFLNDMDHLVPVMSVSELATSAPSLSFILKDLLSAYQSKPRLTDCEETHEQESTEMIRQGKWIAAASISVAILYVFWSGIIRIETR